MKKFKKNKYCIIKNAISKDLSLFVYNYFLIKRKVASTLFENRYISEKETMFGVWTDEQVPNTYSHYADIVMETLLLKLKPVMEKNTGLNLKIHSPNYFFFFVAFFVVFFALGCFIPQDIIFFTSLVLFIY